MLFLDTNIFLSILLNEEKAELCKKIFKNNRLEDLFMSDLSLHSIIIVLYRKRKFSQLNKFINDIGQYLNILSLPTDELKELFNISEKFSLDAEDSYQYAICKKYNLTIATLDQDFQKTDLNKLNIN